MDENLRRPESLLHSSPAYRALDEAARRKLATDTVAVTTFLSPQPSPPRAGKSRASSVPGMRRPLTRPELLPEFVSALVTGTFQAVVDASVKQMEAYAALMAEVAGSVEQFLTDPEQQLEVAMRLEGALREIFDESGGGRAPDHGPSHESA
jgi:hypothetical protein